MDIEKTVKNSQRLRLKFFICEKTGKTIHAKTCVKSCDIYPICERLNDLVKNHLLGVDHAIHRKNKRGKG